MKIAYTAAGGVQVADADGVRSYAGVAGDFADVPDDIASLLIAQGCAEPVADPKPAPKRKVKGHAPH